MFSFIGGPLSEDLYASDRVRLVAPGRELIDTLDAVLRHGFATHDLPGHGLKEVARHFGIAALDREHIRGDRIYQVYRRDPERVRRYATADVEEVAALSRMLGGAAFALARMVPRRYERLTDAGAATGVIDPLLVRAYLRAGMALPAHQPGDRVPHSGAALHLFASGVARRVVKADVASLYPSLMRSYRIGPARDRLGAMLALVDRLVERRVVAEVAALLPPLVQLEFDGRYAAMLSHEPKNYALLGYDGTLLLRGVAFRSSRAEPFGEAFLRRSLGRLLAGDVAGVRDAYLATIRALRRRELPTHDVSSRVRLTKTPARYLETRDSRRELTYEAMLASGRTSWKVGERVRVYSSKTGYGGVVTDPDDEAVVTGSADLRDYDVDHYLGVLRHTFAARLARAFTPADYAAVFEGPDQASLFTPSLATIRTILTRRPPDPSSDQ